MRILTENRVKYNRAAVAVSVCKQKLLAVTARMSRGC